MTNSRCNSKFNHFTRELISP